MKYLLLFLMILFGFSCFHSSNTEEKAVSEDTPEVVVKKRDDGTISSVNQVIDGKTLYSKQTFNYGVKHGPATWYYKNGQVFKQTNFQDGERQSPSAVLCKARDRTQ